MYGIAAKYLVTQDRIRDVNSLIRAIQSNDAGAMTPEKELTNLCDEILCLAVKTAADQYGSNRKNEVAAMIGCVKEVKVKIRCLINTNQLKSAYLLAVKNERIHDIRKILRQAELTNQAQIKKLCEKKLAMSKTN